MVWWGYAADFFMPACSISCQNLFYSCSFEFLTSENQNKWIWMRIWWTETSSIAIFSAEIYLYMSNQLLGLIYRDVPSCPIMFLTSGNSKWWEDLPLHQTMSMWWSKTSSIAIFSADIHSYMSNQLLWIHLGLPNQILAITMPSVGTKFILPYFHQFMDV